MNRCHGSHIFCSDHTRDGESDRVCGLLLGFRWAFVGLSRCPLDCYWVGSLDFSFLVETKVFSTKPLKS